MLRCSRVARATFLKCWSPSAIHATSLCSAPQCACLGASFVIKRGGYIPEGWYDEVRHQLFACVNSWRASVGKSAEWMDALGIAARHHSVTVAQILVEAGADPNLPVADSE